MLILKCLLILSSLIPTFSQGSDFGGACSVYCNSCISPPALNNNIKYNHCSSCASSFQKNNQSSTNQVANCTVKTDDYPLFLSLIQGDFEFSPQPDNADSCKAFGDIIPSFGILNPDTEFTMLYDHDRIGFHYQIRVIASVIFIDGWGNNDNITIKVGPDIELKLTRNGGSSSTNMNNLCKNSGGGGSGNEYFVKGDTNNKNHTALAFDVKVSAPPKSNANWMLVDLIIQFKTCHVSCQICSGPSNTSCTKCSSNTGEQYYLNKGNICDNYCYNESFIDPTIPNTCTLCNYSCLVCQGTSTNCSKCNTNYVLFPATHTCLKNCPTQYYYNSSQEYCAACDITCKTCTDNPSPCQSCNTGFYLFNFSCDSSCPATFFADDDTLKCQNCSVYCVNMTLSRFVPSNFSALTPLMFDLNFTFNIDWNTFDMKSFEIITLGSGISIQNFNISYQNTSSKSFRITISPFSYAFIINQSITVTIRSKPTDFNFTSIDKRPFMEQIFSKVLKVVWTYVYPPSMTQTENNIVASFSSLSTSLNGAFAQPGAQQIKKFGFLLLVLNSLQITSCLVLLNTVLPQNLYQGIRFFASLIFFDVPAWQQQSNYTKFIINSPITNFSSRRLLSSIYVDQFGFRRTGFSGVFIYDVYSQIFLIALCYVLLGLSLVISKYWNRAQKARPYLQKCLDAFHEIAVMYFTITIVFEISYFNWSTVKWASIIICLIVNIYYLIYQIKIYYSLMDFPSIPMNDRRFDEFIYKYSYYLKNIRFDEDKVYSGKWGIYKLWFRPHNYHILSYIKKFMMMLTFPIFYQFGYAQIIVLLIIQAVQILRFVYTWPYRQRWRNIFRLILQIVLITIFALILFIQIIVVKLTQGDSQSSETWSSVFFIIGWVALVLVIFYNLSFFILFCLNWFQNCNYTTRQIIQRGRRDYYFQILKQHQENNETVPIQIVNQCVQKGNLNKRKRKQLPDVLQRIEYYSIQCDLSDNSYYVQIKTITQLAMGTQFNFNPMHNVVPKSIIETNVVLKSSHQLYKLFSSVYDQFRQRDISNIVVKTFIDVEQKNYNFKQIIPIQNSKLSQEVQIYLKYKIQPKVIKLDHLLKGFPIPHQVLQRCLN